MTIKVEVVNDLYGYYRYSQCLCDTVELQMECSGYEPTPPCGDKIAGDFQCKHCESGYSDVCDLFSFKRS